MREDEGVEGVRIHIADVRCGAVTRVLDPHGTPWRDHDVLFNVPFCTQTGVLCGVDSRVFECPMLRHVRVVYCYVAPGDEQDGTAEEKEARRSVAHAAFFRVVARWDSRPLTQESH